MSSIPTVLVSLPQADSLEKFVYLIPQNLVGRLQAGDCLWMGSTPHNVRLHYITELATAGDSAIFQKVSLNG